MLVLNSISIRPATKNDIPIILGLLYELGRPKPDTDSDVDAFRGLVKKYLSDSNKQILVAVFQDVEIVGMASIEFLVRLNWKTPEMYIPELIITEKYQGKKIGEQLIDSCIEIAKTRNCHRIRLESGSQRTDAHKFYKKMEFEQNSLFFSKNI